MPNGPERPVRILTLNRNFLNKDLRRDRDDSRGWRRVSRRTHDLLQTNQGVSAVAHTHLGILVLNTLLESETPLLWAKPARI